MRPCTPAADRRREPSRPEGRAARPRNRVPRPRSTRMPLSSPRAARRTRRLRGLIACHEDLRSQTHRPRAQLAARRRHRADARPARDADRRRAARQAQADVHAAHRHRRLRDRRQRREDRGHRQQARPTSATTGTPVIRAGCKSRTLDEMLERRPEEVIRIAVKGMLPRNRLARKQLTKLKVYAGPEHPHAAQQPQPMEIRRE